MPPLCYPRASHLYAALPGRRTTTTALCSPAGLFLGSALQPLLRCQQQPWQQLHRQRRLCAPRAEQHEQQQGPASESESETEEEREILSESELEEYPAGSSSGGSGEDGRQGTPPGWGRRVLQLPLQAAAILSKEDAHYLQKRGRSRWWKRSEFPRVPADSLQDVAKSPPQLEVGAGCSGWMSWS